MRDEIPKLTLSWVCVAAVALDMLIHPALEIMIALPPYKLSEQGYIFVALVVGVRAWERLKG